MHEHTPITRNADEYSNDVINSQDPKSRTIPVSTSYELVDKRSSVSRSYRTISVHVVYTTKLLNAGLEVCPSSEGCCID
jgi:hypothetical protein